MRAEGEIIHIELWKNTKMIEVCFANGVKKLYYNDEMSRLLTTGINGESNEVKDRSPHQNQVHVFVMKNGIKTYINKLDGGALMASVPPYVFERKDWRGD